MEDKFNEKQTINAWNITENGPAILSIFKHEHLNRTKKKNYFNVQYLSARTFIPFILWKVFVSVVIARSILKHFVAVW